MISDNQPWLFLRKPFGLQELAKYQGIVGFVYIILNTLNQKKYIGMKNFYFKRGKKRIQSDWLDYYGSSTYLLDDINRYGKENFERTILYLGKTRLAVRYTEKQFIYAANAIESPDYYNRSIDGRFQKLNRSNDLFDRSIEL